MLKQKDMKRKLNILSWPGVTVVTAVTVVTVVRLGTSGMSF
jgi:hypothetical protein